VQRFLLAALAALLATVPLVPIAAAVAPPTIAVRADCHDDDVHKAIPTIAEIRAALTAFGAPMAADHCVPDDDPVWELFDQAERFVVPPGGDLNEVTFVVGAYDVDDGTDEHQDFLATLDLLKTYAIKRVGPTGSAVPTQVTAAEELFGANEAVDVTMITRDGGTDKNLMYARLFRFGKSIVFVSGDTNPKMGPVTDELKFSLAFPLLTIIKLISDKTK